MKLASLRDWFDSLSPEALAGLAGLCFAVAILGFIVFAVSLAKM